MTLNILPLTILLSHTERSIVSRQIVAGWFGPVETQNLASPPTAEVVETIGNAKGEIMAVHTCYNCVYGYCDPEVWRRDAYLGRSLVMQCANHPWYPGRMHEVPGVPCRNYRPKPKLPGGDAVRLIPLGDGFYAYVDAADYEWLNQWTWHHYNGGYVGRHEKGKAILMHNLIMSPPKGMLVDHIDGSRNNNCRFNLRICTRQENQRNKRKQYGSISKFKGVCYDPRKKKWYAKCRIGSRRPRLGSFDHEADAARAYDLGAVRWFGEFARLNFPEEWPPERRAQVHAEWQETIKREGWEPAIKGRGPRTAQGQQKAKRRRARTEDRRRRTAGRKRTSEKNEKVKGKASRRKTHDAGRITKPTRATGHESQPTASKRPKRKTQNARRKTKKAADPGP